MPTPANDVLARLGLLADMADHFFQGPRVLPRLEADCLRQGMQDVRNELRAIYIEIAGDNPWNSEGRG